MKDILPPWLNTLTKAQLVVTKHTYLRNAKKMNLQWHDSKILS